MLHTRPSTSIPTEPSGSSELGSSMVEYVGLGALSAMLVSGIAAAIDSAVGDRLAMAVVRRLVAAVAGSD